MSSDDYFDDELDSAILQQVDAIEAAHTQSVAARPPPPPPPKASTPRRAPPKAAPPPPAREVIDVDDSYDFDAFEINDDDIQAFDKACNDALNGKPPTPVAGPSKPALQRTTSGAAVQMTLFGEVAANQSPSRGSGALGTRQTVQRQASTANNLFTGKPNKTKKWDHTAFAKSGWKKPKTAKGKEKAGSFDYGDEEEFEEEEEVEFEQFPAPFISIGPPPPMKLKPDLIAARKWIYPLNQPRRDYQFNIVKRALFENTLVALPTGLGKTFIAGVVMLNFYNWFPEGKVVFVAPTKPLVAQQIEACHKTCGIPGSHAVELTGQNPRAYRAKAWEEKRVFYMTPQTLMNDLKTNNCDPGDIVLLVIDEAHKGTGDYAYAQVIRYMMAKNPHFRVLALTATPGGTPEAVQSIVDSLHISHIEIRDEQSLDLAPYLHKKHVKQHIIEMNDDVRKIRDMLCEVMEPMITKLANARLLYGKPNPVCLHPFSCQKAMAALHGPRGGQAWAFPMLSKLGTLARIMGYLIEGSMEQCHDALKQTVSGVNEVTGKQTATKAQAERFAKDPKLQAIVAALDAQRFRAAGFTPHPKMDKLKTLLVEHFAQKGFDAEDAGAGGAQELDSDSRVMVFTSHRQTVDLIVDMLNREKPLIRAVPFIGQGVDKNGKKGYGQKEQLDVIKRFKAGEFNVLVSTSIGEEGLDIGEIDMIVCYDAQKTPIRMLQRIGRTGRKKDGYVHVLLSEDREERNWEKADDNYKDIQRFILRAEHLELYADVERLIPEHIKPECLEMVMEIEEYVREDRSRKAAEPLPKGKKRVRNDDVMRNIPDGASTGFVSVKDLLKKTVKKRKKAAQPVDFENAGEDDEEDREIEAGIGGLLAKRRTVSMPAAAEQPKAKKMRRTATMAADGHGAGKKGAKAKKAVNLQELTLSEVERMGQSDSEDEALAKGVGAALSAKAKGKKTAKRRSPPPPPAKRKAKARSSDSPLSRLPTPAGPSRGTSGSSSVSVVEPRTPPEWSSSPGRPLADASIIDLTATPDPETHYGSPPAHRWSSPDIAIPEVAHNGKSAASTRSPATVPGRSTSVSSRSLTGDNDAGANDDSIAWLIEDDEDPDIEVIGSSPPMDRVLRDLPPPNFDDSEIEIVDNLPPSSPIPQSPSRPDDFDQPRNGAADMPPPPLPARFALPSSPIAEAPAPALEPSPRSDPEPDDDDSIDAMPTATFAVRAPGKQPRKRSHVALDSSPLAAPPPSQRRLHRAGSRPRSPSPSASRAGSPSPPPRGPKRKKRRFADTADAARHNPWLDVEAAHSGDERSAGSDDDDAYDAAMLASSSDARFAGDFDPTQASPGYDQGAVYRRSLMTQAPGGGSAPVFARRPAARGLFWVPAREAAGRGRRSSSPPADGGSEDEYQFGTFVVPDDEVSYANDSSVLSL